MYKIPCKDCNVSHIFETKKKNSKLEQTSIKEQLKIQDIDKNEIADHCWKNYHEMSREERKLGDAEPYIYARKIKETVHSIKHRDHINSISLNLISY